MKPEDITHPLSPEQLRTVGGYLFSHPVRWQTPMALALGCPVHSVENWAAGRRKPRQWVAHRLRELVEAQTAPDDLAPPINALDLLG
jgi:hypothetical protein